MLFPPMRLLMCAVASVAMLFTGPILANTIASRTSDSGAASRSSSREPGFWVTRFEFAYQDPEDGRGREGALPDLGELTRLEVPLKWVSGQYEALGSGETTPEMVSLGGAHNKRFGASAIVAVSRAVVSELNRRGIYGVLAAVDPDQIDLGVSPPEDLREGAKGELRLNVYYSRVSKVELQRAPHSGPDWLFPSEGAGRRILAYSPVQAGTLLRKDDLQHYLDRVNRFEGRRAQSVLRAGEQPGTVAVALELDEQKRFAAHLMTSNSGTKESGEWRTRLRLDVRQLAGVDDVLSLDYATSEFKKYQTFAISEDFAPGFPDSWKSRLYGSYSDLSLSDLGQTGMPFNSTARTLGFQSTWTPDLAAGWILSFNGGGYVLDAAVENQAAGLEGGATFLVPYVCAAVERQSPRGRVMGSVQMEHAGTSDAGISILGRDKPAENAWISRWNASWTRRAGGVAALFSDVGAQSGGAHEVSLAMHGQVAWDQARLVPHFQGVAGGMDSVRGYRESLAAGDTVSFVTAEYRLQLNSVFTGRTERRLPSNAADGAESSQPTAAVRAPLGLGMEAERAGGRGGAQAAGMFLGKGLPVEVALRGFVDGAQVHQNEAAASVSEAGDRTLIGTGVGIDFVFRGKLNGILRLDLGVALRDLRGGDTGVRAGSSRLHASVFLLW